MIGVLAERLDSGTIQLLCVDGVDMESWYNRHIPVRDRALRHNAYERYLLDEALPWLAERNPAVRTNLTTTGASFGALPRGQLRFRHPDRVQQIVAMSGATACNSCCAAGTTSRSFTTRPSNTPNLTTTGTCRRCGGRTSSWLRVPTTYVSTRPGG